MGTIRFEFRPEKIDQDGKAPIRMIYQISGQRKYYNTGKKLFPQQWDADKQRAVYLDRKTVRKLLPQLHYDRLLSDKEVQEFNLELTNLISQITGIEKRFELDKTAYSAEMVLEKLKEQKTPTTIKETPSKFLFDFIDKYIADHKSIREPGSLSVYKALKTHLQDYQRHTKKKVAFEKLITASFAPSRTF